MASGNIGMKYIGEEKKKAKKINLFSLIKKFEFEIMHNILKKHEDHFFIKKIINKIKDKKIIDKLMYIIALVGPVMTIPQAVTIFQNQDASNMSKTTWITYMFTATSWLIYGISHKEKPIIFSNIMWLLANGSILIGIILYK